MKLSRLQLARFIRIISGHNSLFYFRSKVDPEIKPTCRFCLEEDETFHHLVTDCPRYERKRVEYFYDNIITNDHKWSIKSLIDFSFLPGIDSAMQGSTDLALYGQIFGDTTPPKSDDEEGIG